MSAPKAGSYRPRAGAPVSMLDVLAPLPRTRGEGAHWLLRSTWNDFTQVLQTVPEESVMEEIGGNFPRVRTALHAALRQEAPAWVEAMARFESRRAAIFELGIDRAMVRWAGVEIPPRADRLYRIPRHLPGLHEPWGQRTQAAGPGLKVIEHHHWMGLQEDSSEPHSFRGLWHRWIAAGASKEELWEGMATLVANSPLV